MLQNETAPKKTPVVWGRLEADIPLLKSIDLTIKHFGFSKNNNKLIVTPNGYYSSMLLANVNDTHFVIKHYEEKQITYIKDLSINGTYLNDKCIGRYKTVKLRNNDRISIKVDSIILTLYTFKSLRTLTLSQCSNLQRKYYLSNEILGDGAFGEVRRVVLKVTRKNYAAKRIMKHNPKGISKISSILNEANIVNSLYHPNVIFLKETIEEHDSYFLIFEYMEGGNFASRINDSLTENASKFYFYQVLRAVNYLHSCGITHRDIKPANILLKSKNKHSLIKLCDFGVSRRNNYCLMSDRPGSLCYMAPEIVDPKSLNYNQQCDVWSLGILLFYMLNKRLPFLTSEFAVIRKSVIAGKIDIVQDVWNKISSDGRNLILKMLVKVPQKRITVSNIFKDSWLSLSSPEIQMANILISTEFQENRRF